MLCAYCLYALNLPRVFLLLLVRPKYAQTLTIGLSKLCVCDSHCEENKKGESLIYLCP